MKLPALELRPLRLKVFKLVKVSSPYPQHPWLDISAGETISELCTRLAKAIAPDAENLSPYRIWRVGFVSENQEDIDFAASHLSTSEGKIVEENTKTLEQEGIESDDAFVVEFKQTSGWIVDVLKATPKTSPESSRPLFNSSDGFFNKMSTTLSPVTTPAQAFKPSFYDGLTSNTSKPASTALTVATNKSSTKPLEPGTLGLGNMSVVF